MNYCYDKYSPESTGFTVISGAFTITPEQAASVSGKCDNIVLQFNFRKMDFSISQLAFNSYLCNINFSTHIPAARIKFFHFESNFILDHVSLVKAPWSTSGDDSAADGVFV